MFSCFYESMELSIIIVHYKQEEFLKRCLATIFASGIKDDFEVIVVDNGSGNGMDVWIKKNYPGKVLFIQAGTNLGYGKGNNLGFLHSQGEYILISNADIEYLPSIPSLERRGGKRESISSLERRGGQGFFLPLSKGEIKRGSIQKMLDYLKQHSEVGVLGPQLIYPDGTVQDSYRRFVGVMDWLIKRLRFLHRLSWFKKRMVHYLMWDLDREKVQPVDWLVGACLMIPRQVYQKTGGFDPRYFLLVEDMDFCRSARKGGYEVVYFPEVKLKHNHQRLSGGSFWQALNHKMSWIHLHSLLKYFWKWKWF